MHHDGNCRMDDSRGAALLLTLLTLSLLVVLIGQFSYTVVLDRKVALNYISDAQVSFGVQACVGAAADRIRSGELLDAQGAPTGSAEVELGYADVQIALSIESEDAKFNVNNLLSPPEGVSQDEAALVLERLLKAIDEPEGTLPAGLANGIAQYVSDKGSSVLTLVELTAVEGVTQELLYGNQEEVSSGELDGVFEGLSKYITVWSDGLIDYERADTRVLLSLEDGLNEKTLEVILEAANGQQKLPPNLQELAKRLQRFVKSGSSAFSAASYSQSGNYAKRCMAVLRSADGQVSVILWDELEP